MARLYRSKEEIIVDILRAASDGAKKTHIMQRANLNPLMFRKYFPVLLENRLIVEADGYDGDSIYRVSDDGRDFLRMSHSLRKKLDKKARDESPYLLR